MSAEVADVLRDALALIEDERNWCQRALTMGTESGPAYCAMGALNTAGLGAAYALGSGSDSDRSWLRAFSALGRAVAPHGVAAFNNTHTHAEVVAAFKDAIVAEEWSE